MPDEADLTHVAKELGTDVMALRYGNLMIVAPGTGDLTLDGKGPRLVREGGGGGIRTGGSADITHIKGRHAERIKRVNAFANDLARRGANDLETEFVRERGKHYIEGVLFADGAPELTEAEADAELGRYLERILLLWVKDSMERRGEKLGPAK